jgi:1-acyl-sn-glycerol-3-phosphate acyltransferase
MRGSLKRLYEYGALYLALLMLGMGCLAWSAAALPLALVLPRGLGLQIGRRGISIGFRLYLWALGVFCGCRFDLAALDHLRGAGPFVIAPNHPSLLDALMILSRLPRTVCILKAGLIDNVFMGAGARLAGFIRNDQFVGVIKCALQELNAGYHVLVFPEGTRSGVDSFKALKGSVAVIACRAQVPVQTLIIEADSPFLGKGWPLFRRPDLPMHFRIRLGERFEPGRDPQALTLRLQHYFLQTLETAPPAATAAALGPQPVNAP